MHITSKGQVTIPIKIREQLGLLPDTEVDFEVVGETVRIKKVRADRDAAVCSSRIYVVKPRHV